MHTQIHTVYVFQMLLSLIFYASGPATANGQRQSCFWFSTNLKFGANIKFKDQLIQFWLVKRQRLQLLWPHKHIFLPWRTWCPNTLNGNSFKFGVNINSDSCMTLVCGWRSKVKITVTLLIMVLDLWTQHFRNTLRGFLQILDKMFTWTQRWTD